MKAGEFELENQQVKASPEAKLDSGKQAILQKHIDQMGSPTPPLPLKPKTSAAHQPNSQVKTASSSPVVAQPAKTIAQPVAQPAPETVEEEVYAAGNKITKDHPLWHEKENQTSTWRKAQYWD